MYPVDALHQLIRHSHGEHKRETIAFGRRLESKMGRAYLTAVWKNFIKRRSERRPDHTTPAMRLGLADCRWLWERLFVRRLFPQRTRPTVFELKLYGKAWPPSLPALNRTHATSPLGEYQWASRLLTTINKLAATVVDGYHRAVI